MILGIDLGTTNSLATIFRNGKVELIPTIFGDYLTPSIVALNDEGEVIVGRLAKERLLTQPTHTQAQFKRFMGTKEVLTLGEASFRPEELSSFIIRSLVADAERYLGEPVEEVIISVPAYFNDTQRYATKLAGHLAGLNVERIINEPSAVALARHYEYKDDTSYMVVDFGGGTLDVSIVEAFDTVVEIVAISGDNHLGGEDFTALIAQKFIQSLGLTSALASKSLYQKILLEAEKTKRLLDHQDQAVMMVVEGEKEHRLTFTYDLFLELSQSLLLRLKQAIDKALYDAKYSRVSPEEVILVGGSAKMRLVQEFLEHYLQRDILVVDNPDTVIAIGCGLAAGIKERQGEIKDMTLSDICPFTLGTGLVNDVYSPIIERNQSLPCSREHRYCVAELGQEMVECTIYQGERMRASDNHLLGSMEVPVPRNFEAHEEIAIRFTYDINGLLDIDVTVLSTGEIFTKTILQEAIYLTDEEIMERKAVLAKIKLNVRETELYRSLITRADRLYAAHLGAKRDRIQVETQRFEEKVADCSVSRLPYLCREFTMILDKIEEEA